METFKERSKTVGMIFLMVIVICTSPAWLILWWTTGYNIMKWIEKNF